VMLSSVGLPGLNGFVGEFLILIGAFRTSPWAAAAGSLGIVLGAVYLLWMFQRVMFGPLDNPANQKLADLNARELAVLLPLLAMIIFMGVYPQPFLRRIEPAVEAFVARVESKGLRQTAGKKAPDVARASAAQSTSGGGR